MKHAIAIAAALLAFAAMAQQPMDVYSAFMAQHAQRQQPQQPYAPIPQVSDSYIKPLPMLPPLGTRQCAPVYLCEGNGICKWQQVCR